MRTKIMITLLLILSLSTTYAGKGGGGGSIEQMRQAGALTKMQIIELLKNNGYLIKTQALIPFFESININAVKDFEIKEKLRLMTNPDPINFANDLNWISFRIENCQCDINQNACRIDSPYESYSCFEVDKLSQNLTSFSELVGIATHEISRITIDRNSPYQDDNHRLAKFVSIEISSGKYTPESKISNIFSKCATERGTDQPRISACKSIKNTFALSCAILKGSDQPRINACSRIDSQAELDCVKRVDFCNKSL